MVERVQRALTLPPSSDCSLGEFDRLSSAFPQLKTARLPRGHRAIMPRADGAPQTETSVLGREMCDARHRNECRFTLGGQTNEPAGLHAPPQNHRL